MKNLIPLSALLVLAGCSSPQPPAPVPQPAPEVPWCRPLTGSRRYELTISPTWGNKVSFRLASQGSGGTLRFERHPGRNGFTDGRAAEVKVQKLTGSEFHEFESIVAASGFEAMGMQDPDMGLDGDSWTLTARRPGFRHSAARWCPNTHDPVKRGTVFFAQAFKWCADKAGVTAVITNKGHSIFDRQ